MYIHRGIFNSREPYFYAGGSMAEDTFYKGGGLPWGNLRRLICSGLGSEGAFPTKRIKHFRRQRCIMRLDYNLGLLSSSKEKLC